MGHPPHPPCSVKLFLSGIWEWFAEILRCNAFLMWAAEHFEGDSRNLAGMFWHNSVGGELNVENAFLFLMRAASNSQWIPRSSLGSSCSVFHLFTVVLSPYSLSASESPFRRLPLHVPSGELTATELYKTFSKKLIWIELISALCVPQVTKRDATFEIKFTQPRATP